MVGLATHRGIALARPDACVQSQDRAHHPDTGDDSLCFDSDNSIRQMGVGLKKETR